MKSFSLKYFLVFLVLNFVALGIGSYLMGEGPSGDYYQNLQKAPWTPPGWVFGAAWTTIMIAFAVFMSYWYQVGEVKNVVRLYALQWILNVAWNPLFFQWKMVAIALIAIIALTILVAYFLFGTQKQLRLKSLFVAPYFIWLCIATSLNAYILMFN